MKTRQIHQVDLVGSGGINTVSAPRDKPSDVIYDALPDLHLAAKLP